MHDDTFLTALTGRFDAHEEHLRSVALRMTGSTDEAERALAAARAGLGREEGAAGVRAWLTALVGRECVRRIQGRGDGAAGTRGTEDPTPAVPPRSTTAAPGPTGHPPLGARAAPDGSGSPLDSVWLALFVVLESLKAEERLAYVLHDVFGLPPYETARVTGGSPDEAAHLARRVRARIRGGGAGGAEGDPGRQRGVVDRFLAAARARDARVLAAVLDPDVVAYSERSPVHGAPSVSEGAAAFARFADVSRPALVDGSLGAVAFVDGRPVSAVAFTLRGDRIVTLTITTGENRVRALDLAFPEC
ncbi:MULTISPECIES: RNA polymerase subunit sigma-70 [unclassified Streptomyces]|uniref:RNA polymerase subunit sigma-70 n=1 Tax=unclassified Streptomyces TaxID=2593676 RepID=UPI0007001A42|nr:MULTISPECIES: RNA polymerase subunit sigma-70 [unclassified Streptomyces]KQX47916.1 RNA polymerase subunit sigma-70 [Streptomyces sp. Root1304]KRA82307.1 RNA polymerase subunit sigma-70 [Streptomyces sp. Root66D1]